MSLPIPVVLTEPGPQYALDVNSCMSILDGHNHTSGMGVQIPPDGLNINSDLTFSNNRLTLAKSITFTPQGGLLPGVSPDIGAIYVSGVDLYYNDISGNQIRLTQNGNIVGGSGSISGLVAPASASYNMSNTTFVWQSNVNTSAAMDNGPITIREEIANANGITVQSPSALAADYSLTLLPALPLSTSYLIVDPTGNITATKPFIKPTGSTVGVGGFAISGSSGNNSINSATPTDVTNASITITTQGNPVKLMIQPDGTGSTSEWGTNGSGTLQIFWVRGVTTLNNSVAVTSSTDVQIYPDFSFIDTPAAGTYTYKVQTSSTVLSFMRFTVLTAYEL